MSQNPGPDPLQQLQLSIQKVQSDLSSLQNDIRFTSIRDEVGKMDTVIATLPQKAMDIRAKGYVFEKSLESKVSEFAPKWMTLQPVIQNTLNQQSMQLEMNLRSIQQMVMQLVSYSGNLNMATPVLNQVESAISMARSNISSADSNIRTIYGAFKKELDLIANHIKQLSDTLDLFAAATFQLNTSEGAIAAVKAVYINSDKEDKEDPHGYAFLTDQRFLFEQNQDVATKKFLFVTTASEKVQKLLFEFPAALIDDANPTKQGLFKNEDHIKLQLAQEAPFQTCHLHLDGQDCNDWDKMISRVKAREYDNDRAIEIPKEEVEKVKTAPSLCPACGGVINQVVLRGQDTITCTYCGNVIRL
jgi:hypothetical protein